MIRGLYFKSLTALSLCFLTFILSPQAHASTEKYTIDIKGQHAFIQFKIQHLGYSWLLGSFNQFSGHFSLDREHPENSSVDVKIDIQSIDTNHADRDKHLRGKDFFDVEKFPIATFKSRSIELIDDTSAIITGHLKLKGVAKLVKLKANHIGGGKDPWGGYRQGFEATAKIRLKDFGIDYELGPAAEYAEIYLSIEGIKQHSS